MAHHTVHGSKRSAQAVYIVRLSRACDWLVSALSAVLVSCFSFTSAAYLVKLVYLISDIGRCGKFGKYGAYKPGNDFELIPTVKMETRHPVDGSFGSEFPAIYNQCRVMAAWSRKTECYLFTVSNSGLLKANTSFRVCWLWIVVTGKQTDWPRYARQRGLTFTCGHRYWLDYRHTDTPTVLLEISAAKCRIVCIGTGCIAEWMNDSWHSSLVSNHLAHIRSIKVTL